MFEKFEHTETCVCSHNLLWIWPLWGFNFNLLYFVICSINVKSLDVVLSIRTFICKKFESWWMAVKWLAILLWTTILTLSDLFWRTCYKKWKFKYYFKLFNYGTLLKPSPTEMPLYLDTVFLFNLHRYENTYGAYLNIT